MAEKPKKPQKLKARLPRGLEDRGPAAIAATRQMVEKIREVYERYGFEPVETPAMEFTDALGKFLPDQDRPNEGVFSFQDDDEQWLSLRYDLTAPLARYVAENFDALPSPIAAIAPATCSATRSRARPLPPVHAVRRRHGRLASPPPTPRCA
jgi:histidyl-tRNA synthetase